MVFCVAEILKVLQTAGFEGEFWGERCEWCWFSFVEINAYFHHLYSRYIPKRCSGFSYIIDSHRWWNMAGTGFSIEAGSWGEMVKLLVSSFLRAQIKSTLRFCCLPPCFQKPRPLLTHDCKHKALHRYLGLQYWGGPFEIWPISTSATVLHCGVETSSRGDAGTANDGGGS